MTGRDGRQDAAPGFGRSAPPRVVRTAHLVAMLPLPSALWRLGLVIGFTMGIRRAAGVDGIASSTGQSIAILGLTIVAETVGLLTLGLVRPWGEVFPRWLPVVGGRRVPATGVTVTATAGAVALSAIWTFAAVNFVRLTVLGAPESGFVFAGDGWAALMIGCYLPLLAWGPLLLLVIRDYHRRHRADRHPVHPRSTTDARFS